MSKEKKNKNEKGTLFIVATPIGNLEDITLRAIRVLSEVDIIAAEDTRRAKILLSKYDINTPTTSFFSAHQKRKAPLLINRLLSGDNVALITEAGTPGVSDPGSYLASIARENDIEVIPLPGPSALAAAISVAGLNKAVFTFFGFLAPKGSKRNKALNKIAQLDHPAVLYESPHRLSRTLKDIFDRAGDRKLIVAREMTKIHEEIYKTTIEEAIEKYEKVAPRGEFTLIIGEKT